MNRRDPAPSRIAYRLQRLWLTPSFRSFLRLGLPMLALLGFVSLYLSDPRTRADLADTYAELRRSIEERPEFMVKLMAIDSASSEVIDDINEITAVDFPISSFHLDLEEMHRAITGLDAVARADLHIRPGGILQVRVTERVPAVVWRGRDSLELLDAEGHRVSSIPTRATRGDLPLLAGEGADHAVPEALEIFAAAEPIAGRLRGLVRVGERRWDVVLDRDQRIMLPENGAVSALEHVMAIDEAQDLLARDVEAVDIRNERRPTVRMATQAVSELRRIRDLQAGTERE